MQSIPIIFQNILKKSLVKEAKADNDINSVCSINQSYVELLIKSH